MTEPVPRPARDVSDDWANLHATVDGDATFTPALMADLPEVARRWLTHAIEPGTPLWRSVEFRMRGEIRMGRWHPFTARQVLAPGTGFLWAASARVFGLPMSGFDRYSAASGQMRWRLFGRIPTINASDPDVTRSAAGRLAAEAVLVPTTFAAAQWSESSTPDAVCATWTVDSNEDVVDVHVARDGAVRKVTMQRWRGTGKGAGAGRYPFIVTFAQEQTFSGVTIPTWIHGSWGTEGEFFRAQISDATYR